MSHGTTVGTNALIEKKSGKVAIVTTKGFRDLLELGRQTRPTVYDMHKDHPTPIVDRALRFEINQRTLSDGKTKSKLKEEEIKKLHEATSGIGSATVESIGNTKTWDGFTNLY